ncbi:MAG: hypothetical protein KDI87_01765 [Gammaproteobacteria bacterium]|nr:hypothetical protein [Gammaproteobacteria bacterium]MCP5140667.1 hypothetical protein [Chromatiales bacterium]
MSSSYPCISARHRTLLPVLSALGLVACNMLAGSQPAVALDQQMSPGLGRLFMTDEERRALDAARPSIHPGNPDAAASAPIGGRVVLNGILKRSDGPPMVWINGRAASSKDSPVQVRRGPDTQNTVTLLDTADGRSVRLKPGQSWTP